MFLRAQFMNACLVCIWLSTGRLLNGAEIPDSVTTTDAVFDVINVTPGRNTLSAAFQKLQNRHGKQTFLLAPGTYYDNAVLKDYNDGIVIRGAGGSAATYKNNKVTIVSSIKGTASASALAVETNDVEVYNIDFINTFGRGTDHQAVALTAQGDNHVYGQCSFKSFQDTLYDLSGRHLFVGCYIEGAVDFIFGTARSFYQSCDIGIVAAEYHQIITAHGGGSPGQDPFGIFVFDNARIFDVGKVPLSSTYLGRAWGPAPKVLWQSASFPASINPDGWSMNPAFGKPIRWSSNGFYEYPTLRTKSGHRASRSLTKDDVLRTNNMP